MARSCFSTPYRKAPVGMEISFAVCRNLDRLFKTLAHVSLAGILESSLYVYPSIPSY